MRLAARDPMMLSLADDAAVLQRPSRGHVPIDADPVRTRLLITAAHGETCRSYAKTGKAELQRVNRIAGRDAYEFARPTSCWTQLQIAARVLVQL